MNNFVTVEHLPWKHSKYGNNKEIAKYVLSKHNNRTPKKIIIFFIETAPIKCIRKKTIFNNHDGEWHPIALLQKQKQFNYQYIRYVTVPCMNNFPYNKILLNTMKKMLLEKKSELQNIVILRGYKNLPDSDEYGMILNTVSRYLNNKKLSNMNMLNVVQNIFKMKSENNMAYALQNILFILHNLDYLISFPEYQSVFKIKGNDHTIINNLKSLEKISLQYREIQTMQNIKDALLSNEEDFKKLFPSCKNIYEIFRKHVSLYLLFGGGHTFNDNYFLQSKIRVKIKKINRLSENFIYNASEKSKRLSLRKIWIRYNNQNINWNKLYKAYCNQKVWKRTIERKTKGARDFKLLYSSKKDELDCVKYNCAVLFEIPFDRKKFSDIFYPGINSLKSNCFYRFTELGCHILPVSVFKRNSNSLFVFDFEETSFLIYNKTKIEKSEADRMDIDFNAAKNIILKCYGIFKNNPNLSEYHLKELDLLAVQIDCYLK